MPRRLVGKVDMKTTSIAVLMGALLIVTCGYGGASDDAIARNLSWFNYVAAENLREPCGPGAANRIRLVYNGIYDEQIRSYDVRELPETRGAAFTAFARGDGDLTQGIPITNLLKSLRGERLDVSVPTLQVIEISQDFVGKRPDGDCVQQGGIDRSTRS